MGRLGSDRIAWALFAAALGWRALHLLELSGLPDWDQVRGDEQYYLEAARALRNGTLEGPFHMSPLYIAGLAALQALFGESPWVWRLAQSALGLSSALLLHYIPRPLLGLCPALCHRRRVTAEAGREDRGQAAFAGHGQRGSAL